MKHFIRTYSQKLKHRTKEAIAYFYNYTIHDQTDHVRVIIFAQGRTGSSLLENLLSSTGHFRGHGELLSIHSFYRENGQRMAINQGEVFFPYQYIKGLSKWRKKKNFICHIKIYHLTDWRKYPVNPEHFVKKLHDDGWKIIHLRRKNKVNHTISKFVRDYRGEAHKFNNETEEYHIKVDCERFVNLMNDRIKWDKQEKEVLAGIEHIDVVYEDDLERSESHQKTVDRILDYLSLERRKATTKYKKIVNQPHNDLISNYDEFVDCVTRQGWAEFL